MSHKKSEPTSENQKAKEQRERVRRLLDSVTVHRTHDARADDDYLDDVPPHHG